MIDESQLDQALGATLYDRGGVKIGTIEQIYVDDDSGRPSWLTVSTGLLASSESFVPLAEAELDDRGVTVPYERAMVKDAPHAADDGHLDEARQDELYRYYGLHQDQAAGPPQQPGRAQAPAGGPDTAELPRQDGAPAAADRLADQPSRDGAPGRSGSILIDPRVDRTDDGQVSGAGPGTAAGAVAGAAAASLAGATEERRGRHASDVPVDGGASPSDLQPPAASGPAPGSAPGGEPARAPGRMRLRRYVITEQRTITVPVTREEVRLEPVDAPPSGEGVLVADAEVVEVDLATSDLDPSDLTRSSPTSADQR